VAQANLDRVKAGARPEEIAAAQARLDQAQAGLAAATLVAPFAGTVAAVNVKEGEMVAPEVPVVTLGDLSHLRLETDDLSETNIARINLGMPVSVTFEALPDKTAHGLDRPDAFRHFRQRRVEKLHQRLRPRHEQRPVSRLDRQRNARRRQRGRGGRAAHLPTTSADVAPPVAGRIKY
jgi:multidrug efflux pump subunit AcrA (membrane-fusion protein)